MMGRQQSAKSGVPRFEFPDGELDSALMLGDVTDRSVRVWVRQPAGETRATLHVAGERLARAVLRPAAEDDHVAAAVLATDEPRPRQAFDVTGGDVTRRFHFGPREGIPGRFTFAFGSCHQPFTTSAQGNRVEKHAGARIYPQIRWLLLQRRADFGMWLGDQVYSDAVSSMSVRQKMSDDSSITDADLLATYRHRYRGYFNESGFRELASSVPTYLIWDDHDIFDGWGSLLDKTPFDDRSRRHGAVRPTTVVEQQQTKELWVGTLAG